MEDAFLNEYSSPQAVLRYTRATAGYGISYLLEHEYGNLYREVLRRDIPSAARRNGIRVLEFGCGGAMNLIYLVLLAERLGIKVHEAYGTDFSAQLIDAAATEAKKDLPEVLRQRVKFLVARNETLGQDLAAQRNLAPVPASFDLIVGVNTIRYCHRAGKESDCAREMMGLLEKGGVCMVIDMNNRFPLFRSRLRDWLTKPRQEHYLPTLEEYVRPFRTVGFDIVREGTFCWTPHSAGPWLCKLCQSLTPVLDALLPAYAMRSFVIARKPA